MTEANYKLGCAPIAWTNDDMPELGKENTFEQCISEMALAGYEGTEIGNKYPKDPAELHKYLKIRNLSVASAWFSALLTSEPYDITAEAFKAHRDFLHAMGAKVIVVSEQGNSIQGRKATPIFDEKPVFTEEEWDKVTTGLEKLGDLAHEKDMEVVYHHHMGTGVQTTEEIDRLMAETDPKKVSLLYDTGHLLFSGEDPLEVLEKHSDRIKHYHFKDIRPHVVEDVRENKESFLQAVRKGAFTVPGDGNFDYRPVMEHIKNTNYSGWIVVEAEQDPAVANPFEYSLQAIEYLNSL